ncbi:MAG TPA: acylneuraminate cytidylyltransferase family protein [Magnetospirillum sp.]|nr:acylneuraminate cytidylyltransferase family protein [Magnetospirillum sp.]
MIGQNRVVAIIPARAGSKSVPLKNLKDLGGKPLIAWPIDVALATPEIDRVIVSTDGEQIAEVARACGAEVAMRPADLASDTAIVADVLRHHIRELRAQGETARYMVLLEPTSPFRLPKDISACLRELEEKGLDSVATFMEPHLNPHRAWRIEGDVVEPFIKGAVPWLPRQLQPKAFQLNGAVYGFVMDELTEDKPGLLFGKVGAVMMDQRRSIDIDTSLDFVVANALLAENVLADA